MATSELKVNSDIGGLIRQIERDWTTGKTTKSKYVESSLFEDINTIDAYLNSCHISGKTDSLGREKPFYNIVTMQRNVWYRATDIDRKNIIVSPGKIKDTLLAFFATSKLQRWMKDNDFGTFLNKWGLVLSAYNSAVVKMVEQEKTLLPIVIPWNRIYCDELDFDNNPKVEILEFTPAQLRRNKSYDQALVEALISAQAARTTPEGQQKDTKTNYIKLYEIHGNLPLSYLTGKEKDAKNYAQQMHAVSFQEKKEKGDFDDYTLYKGKEKQDPYMSTWLIPSEDGSISLWGSVKNLFEAQWMVNDSAKKINDYLGLASMMIWQTSDGNLQGQNALNSIVNGDFIIHAPNAPLTMVPTANQNITVMQGFGQQWEALANRINGVSESMLGEVKSGTAWRQTEALLQESHSLFDLMTENKGLHIEKMMRKFVIPNIKKQLKNKDELVTTLDDYGVEKIDQIFIKKTALKKANKKLIDKAITSLETGAQMPTSVDYQSMISQEQQAVTEELSALGNNRFYKPDELDKKQWEDILNGFDWDNLEIDTTGESKDKQTLMTTLNSVFMAIAKNPAILQDPNAKMVFNEILNVTGAISPLQIKEAQTNQQLQAPMPAMAQAPAVTQ